MPTYPLLKISSFTRPITSSNVLPKSIMRMNIIERTTYHYPQCATAKRSFSSLDYGSWVALHVLLSSSSTFISTLTLLLYLFLIPILFLQYTISWRRETSSDQPSYSILKVDVFLC